MSPCFALHREFPFHCPRFKRIAMAMSIIRVIYRVKATDEYLTIQIDENVPSVNGDIEMQFTP